jgi:hypothetical protein
MTRTQWAVVVGLLAFILVIFGVLLYQLQVPEQSSTPPPPAFLLEEGAQARTVYPIAEQEALRWQSDAQLASAEVVWDDLGPGGKLTRDRWTFEFYSPSQQRMAVIRVVDGRAERLRTALVPNRLEPLPLNQWQVDSTQALQTWWERGGGDFVQSHRQVSISLKLRMEPKSTRSLWSVAGSSSGEHLVVQIDSSDGTIVE